MRGSEGRGIVGNGMGRVLGGEVVERAVTCDHARWVSAGAGPVDGEFSSGSEVGSIRGGKRLSVRRCRTLARRRYDGPGGAGTGSLTYYLLEYFAKARGFPAEGAG